MNDSSICKRMLIHTLSQYFAVTLKRLPNPLITNKGKPKESLRINNSTIISDCLHSGRTEKDKAMKLLVINKEIVERHSRFLAAIKCDGAASKFSNSNSQIITNINSKSSESMFHLPAFTQLPEQDSKQKVIPEGSSLNTANQSTTINSISYSKDRGSIVIKDKSIEIDGDSMTEQYIPRTNEDAEHFDYLKYYFDSPLYREEYQKIDLYIGQVAKIDVNLFVQKSLSNFQRDIKLYERS